METSLVTACVEDREVRRAAYTMYRVLYGCVCCMLYAICYMLYAIYAIYAICYMLYAIYVVC